MKKLHHFKSMGIGFLAGAMVMTATPALAAVYKTVSATLMHDVTFRIDDKTAVTNGDQPVLNYNGYTYVPTRFVAEQFDADVTWDAAKRQVVIKKPEIPVKEIIVEKPVEKIVYVNRDDVTDDGKTVYNKIPYSKTFADYTVALKYVSMDEEAFNGRQKTRVTIEARNNSADWVQLYQYNAKLTLDDKDYEMTSQMNSINTLWDKTFIEKDKSFEGNLTFDGVKLDYNTGSITFEIRYMKGNNLKSDTVTINFKK